MKKISLLLSLITLLLLSCFQNKKLPPLTSGEITGKSLWQRITKEEKYTKYQQWPDLTGIVPGQTPHGITQRIFIHPLLFNAVPIQNKKAPYGSILVKENYNSQGEFTAITVMAKIEKYDPDNGDWFWAHFNPDGTVNMEGNVKGCLECHTGIKANDYIFTKQLDKAF